MKACYFLVLFVLSSQHAFSQTDFKKSSPYEELRNYYDLADPAKLSDFPNEEEGEGYLTCQEWKENGTAFEPFGFLIRVVKKTNEGAYKGSGPLFPDYAGIENTTAGLAFRGKKENMNPEKVIEAPTDLEWEYKETFTGFFRKKDKFIFFLDTNGTDTQYYGYCWK